VLKWVLWQARAVSRSFHDWDFLFHLTPVPVLARVIYTTPRASRFLRLVSSNPEDRKCCGHPLEFRKRCILVYWHVRPRSRCSLQVRFQDGCALVGGNLFELHLLTTGAPENCSSTAARTFRTQFTLSPSIDTR